ncbi:PREDICTED: eukaryotic translation initiation factor 3 subunit A-like [Camelina sativa]|uniref:Eukaryotic translation initiation factor 3 subunit A-like n=1 Tax=Camelina sativa TaxID=90675 RepID=A0ABM0U639_CAMSA|nr:PREDICTED: eukaryotic translation initiation factor 3 subunit A-like [Camelina sativa]
MATFTKTGNATQAHNQPSQFCKQYNRTREFHRARDRPDLLAPESLQRYLETRFEQLKVSTELGIWKEAFRTAEDICGLMCMVKETPKSSLLVVYYSKLTEIFWSSSNHLYHASAWFKLFSLQKIFNKNLSQKDLQLIASSVVLAVLSVPLYGRSHGASILELENEKEHNLRMSNLIGVNLEPKVEGRDMLSPASLLSELVSRGVLSYATPEVKELYHFLEHEFHPLDLGPKIKLLLDRISKLGGELSSAPSLPEVQLSQYVPSLEKIATLKLLQRVSKMYQAITIKNLAQLVPFFDFSAVEMIAADAVRNNFVDMKVDHIKGVVIFRNLSIKSDGLKDHLANFSETMNKVRAMLFPAPSKSSQFGDIVPNLEETVEKEHKRLLARKSIIEKIKEEQERQQLEMEREEEQRKLKLLKLTEEAEQQRLALDLQEKRRQRILREIEERELEEAQEKVTKQSVIEKAMSEKRKKDQEMEKKLQRLAKTMDYLERAKREEAAPLIEAAYQQRLVEEREVKLRKELQESDPMEKKRLEIFQERVIGLRQYEFERLRKEQDEGIVQMIRARKQETDNKKKQIHHLKSEEERIKKLQEKEEARQREETEKRRKEEAERRAKCYAIAEKKWQREEEIEERLRVKALLG